MLRPFLSNCFFFLKKIGSKAVSWESRGTGASRPQKGSRLRKGRV